MSPPEVNPPDLIDMLDRVNLAELRLRAGFNATEVARVLRVDVSTVRRWEEGHTSATKRQILDYLEAIGYRKTGKGMFEHGEQVDDPYFLALAVRDALLAPLEKLRSDHQESTHHLLPELAFGISTLKKTLRRPRVALLGQKNAGKSTLGNELLGAAVFPAAQKKLTRVPVILRHLDHLPRNRSHVCLAFPAGTKISALDDDVNMPMPVAWGDEHLPAQLGIYVEESVIPDFVKRLPRALYEKFFASGDSTESIGVILLYIRNPLLRFCDLVDTPGVSKDAGDRDTEVALTTQQQCDMSYVCSGQAHFLDGPEHALATNAVKQGSWMSISRYLGIATQGDPSMVRHRSRIQEGLAGVVKGLDADSSLLDELMERTLNFVDKSRGESDEMIEFIRNELTSLLPALIKRDFYRTVAGWRIVLDQRIDAQIEMLRAALDGKVETSKILDVFEHTTMPEAMERAADCSAKIARLCRQAQRVMLDAADKLCTLFENEAWVANRISTWYSETEKELAKTTIVSRLGTMIDKELATVGEAEALLIAREAVAFDRAGDSMAEAITKAGADTSKVSSVTMDRAVAPAIGIVGLVTVGGTALTGTLAAVGGVGVVGGLASSVVGLGAAAGGAIGGAFGIAGFGAALGAALTGVAIAVGVVAAVAWAIDLLTNSWQERLARNVVKHFKTSSLRKNLSDGIESFWQRETKIWHDSFEQYKERLQRDLAMLREQAAGMGTLDAQLTDAIEIQESISAAFAQHWDASSFVQNQQQEESDNG